MPATEWGWSITDEELSAWTLHSDAHLFVVNKPGLVVCHPSKHGPRSSLVGACREFLKVDTVHLPSRLDRETSGVVVLALDPEWGSRLQKAIQLRQVTKTYHAVLDGVLTGEWTVDAPIGRAPDALVVIRQAVRDEGQPSVTRFIPLKTNGRRTLVRVEPATGRLHQIRVHASSIGHPVTADKIYGADERFFLRFIEKGFTPELARHLPLRRHALHASRLVFHLDEQELEFNAPFPRDLQTFCEQEELMTRDTTAIETLG